MHKRPTHFMFVKKSQVWCQKRALLKLYVFVIVVSAMKNSGDRRRVDVSPVGQRSTTPQQTNGNHGRKKSLSKDLPPFGKSFLLFYLHKLSAIIRVPSAGDL